MNPEVIKAAARRASMYGLWTGMLPIVNDRRFLPIPASSLRVILRNALLSLRVATYAR